MPTAPRKTAASTARAAKGKGVVEFRSRTFTIPTDAAKISIEALEAIEGGNVLRSVRELLGEKQYGSLREVMKTAADLNAFYEEVQKALTASPGE